MNCGGNDDFLYKLKYSALDHAIWQKWYGKMRARDAWEAECYQNQSSS